MIKNNRVLAIIPARGGSKGIKDKNILNLEGKPLIEHTIEAAIKSEVCDTIMVSTDSERIAEAARKSGAEVPFMRSKYLSTDTSKTIDAVIEVINNYKKLNQDYDILLLLQPTSPLRDSNDIKRAFNSFLKFNMESVVSINEINDHPVLFRTINDGKLVKFSDKNSTIRRQDFNKIYRVNGAIYINKISEVSSDLSFNDNKYGIIMSNYNSIDIDTELDFEFTQFLMKRKLKY